jgi:hypothetical protein
MAVELNVWHRWWKQHGSRELRDLLMLWWDPVGVHGVPEAIGEYDDNVGQVGRLLREGVDRDGLVAYFAENDFGVGPAPEQDELAARRVMEWFEQSMRRLEEWDIAPGPG